ncbi:MAG: DUF2569 domain-containing protein [Alphaproteobacteria bacterium]|nr:DUF2569 domain-containing protein [Alphaproteobacteria bacterium]
MAEVQRDPWAEELIYAPAQGIGGWLWIPLIQLLVTPLAVVGGILKIVKPMVAAAQAHELAKMPAFDAATAVVILASVAQAAMAVYCLILLFRKRERLPRAITRWYWLTIAVSALTVLQFTASPSAFQDIVNAAATAGSIGRSATFSILSCGLFIVYFAVSTRVKNTFVR